MAGKGSTDTDQTQVQQFKSASLQVGDLHPSTNEGDIQEHFKAQNIVSVKVCRDFQNGESLCQGQINFVDVPNAERAITNENYTVIKGRECRLMWQQRDPTLRITSKNNLIVRNIRKDLTTQELSALFSGAGNIISCKVSKNAKGVSEGFGFVQFSGEEEAQKAVQMFNAKADVGKNFGEAEKDLLVDVFEKSDIRKTKDVFNNLQIKNFPEEWDDLRLTQCFEEFGNLTSVKIERNPNGASKGFGYICQEDPEAAREALESRNMCTVDGRELFVSKFMKKSERLKALKKENDRKKKSTETHNNNLQVKQLDEKITEAELKQEFDRQGDLVSVKIDMTTLTDKDGNERLVSKGVAFVSQVNADDAMKALNEMNGKVLMGKPIQVSVFMNKSQRKHLLESQFNTKSMMNVPFMGNNRAGPMNMNMMARGGMMKPMGKGMPPMNQYNMMNPMQNPMMKMQMPMGMNFQGQGGRGGSSQNMHNNQQKPRTQMGFTNKARNVGNPPEAVNGLPNSQNTTTQPQTSAQTTLGQQVGTAPTGPTNSNLAINFNRDFQASLEAKERKQQLGEIIYPLVQAKEPQTAAKITGMLLEIEDEELINFIKSTDMLARKIDEANNVLKRQNNAPAGPKPTLKK